MPGQGLEDSPPPLPRDVLQDDVRMHQVEISVDAAQLVIGFDELHAGNSGGTAIALRLGKHGWRNIDTHHTSGAPREWNHQAADAASEIQRGIGEELYVEDPLDVLPDPHGMRFAGYERSEEHTSELQSLLRISSAVSRLKN